MGTRARERHGLGLGRGMGTRARERHGLGLGRGMGTRARERHGDLMCIHRWSYM